MSTIDTQGALPPKHYVTCKAAIWKDGKLLLQRENKSNGKGTKLDLPGGRADFGENAHDALKRELKEEAGVEAETVSDLPVKIWSVVGGEDSVIALLFKATLKAEEFEYDGVEVVEAKYFSYEEAISDGGLDNSVHGPFIKEYMKAVEKNSKK